MTNLCNRILWKAIRDKFVNTVGPSDSPDFRMTHTHPEQTCFMLFAALFGLMQISSESFTVLTFIHSMFLEV